MTTSRYPQVIVNLRPEHKEALKAQAAKERRTISEIVRFLLIGYLEETAEDRDTTTH